MDPEYHYRIGQALAPLREKDVLIVGSGQITHNMRQSSRSIAAFDAWVTEVACSEELSPEERRDRILGFWDTTLGRESHPTPEHFIPFIVSLGAAHGNRAEKLNNGLLAGVFSMSNFRFDVL
eukprot:TRINITY_DN928_c0_g1_i1.p2 TRINITY_DN928_c0_g1~~TRINITY_DN928_c0_g1_i1.p2  ORF type:complete len:122 (-),score=20.66 TRINITY_DN928_c0_g1_i1:91-456(-)